MDATAVGFAYPSNGNFDWNSGIEDAVQSVFGGVKDVDEAMDAAAAVAQEGLDELNF